jgi:hypothetical protein
MTGSAESWQVLGALTEGPEIAALLQCNEVRLTGGG